MSFSPRKINRSQGGFTIIETLIYIGLFAIIISGAIVSIYGIIEANARNQTKAMVQEEGSFLLGKIDWALTGVKINSNTIADIDLPALNSSNDTLTLSKYEAGVLVDVTIKISGGEMTIDRGGTLSTLNNDNVSIECPALPENCFIRSSGSPESVKAKFLINTNTSQGLPYSQNFSTIKYLRK